VRVHAEVVAGGLQPRGALGEGHEHMLGATMDLRDLGIGPEVPPEPRGGTGSRGQVRPEALGVLDHRRIPRPRRRIAPVELETLGLDVNAQECRDHHPG
jgi:hypothetical protein